MAIIPLSFGLGGGGGSDEVTATKNQVLAGYTAITHDSNDEPIEGTIPSKNSQNYYASTSDQTIASGQYLKGNQTLKALSQSNFSASNIKKDVNIKINNGDSDILDETGTYTTPSAGQNPITADKVLEGCSGFVNGGAEVQGNIPLKEAQTYYGTTSDQTIATGQYLNGAQTIKPIAQNNLFAENIKKGVTVNVNNGNANVYSVTGTYTTPSSGQSPITSSQVLSGYSGFVNGGAEVEGNISSQSAKNVYATTGDQTAVASGKYCSGNITLKALSQSNLASGNILRGKTISVSNGNANVFSATGNNSNLKCVVGSASQTINSDTTNITISGLSTVLYFMARTESHYTNNGYAYTQWSGCFGNTNILSSTYNDYGMYVKSISPSSSAIQYITSGMISGNVITVYHYNIYNTLTDKSGTIYYYAFGY